MIKEKQFISILFILLAFLSTAAFSALPFNVKPGHPRIYIDQSRVAVIQAAANASRPLFGTNFPQSSGALSFDILPSAKTASTSQSDLYQVFDRFSTMRDHIFIRHYDSINPNTGNTYCNSDPSDTSILCFQLALQSSTVGQYIAFKTFTLAANQWSALTIAWDSTTHTASLQVGAAAPLPLSWKKDGNNNPYDWQPDDQEFIFKARGSLDNIRVYNGNDIQTGTLLADYTADEGNGLTVADVSNNNNLAKINLGVSWALHSSTTPNDFSLLMDGLSGEFKTDYPSVIAGAWQDFYASATNVAQQLIAGTSTIDVATAHPNGIIKIARQLGLGYLVTGNTDFLTAATAFSDQLLGVIPRDQGGDYTQAGRIEAMGILYDWFFTDFGAQIYSGSISYRDALAEAVKETLVYQSKYICGSNNPITTTPWGCTNLPATPDAVGGHSHQNNTEMTAALLAMIDEYPELEPLLTIEYESFINRYNPVRAWISVDGGHHMGWHYGATYTFLDSIQLFESATDVVSMLDAWQGKLIDRYIYGLRGDFSYPAGGDAFNGIGVTPTNEQVTAFALWASQKFNNTYSQNFYNQWVLPSKGGYRFNELLYWAPGYPESPIGALETSRYFRNAGQVVMRDTWNYPDATLLEFKSTSFWSTNHHHLDQNAFTLFYKTPLLLDSGFYDSYWTEHWHNYFTRTIAHNSLTVFDPNEVFVRGTSGVFCCSNDGGQRFIPPSNPQLQDIQSGGSNHLDGITAYEYTPNYTYTAGNASKAYSNQKLDQNTGFLRSLVYLNNPAYHSHPITVVFDKVTSTPAQAGLTKRLLFHTANEPVAPGNITSGAGVHTISGNTVEIRNGDGMLFSETLLPINSIITKIGGIDVSGTDYRFAVPTDEQGNYAYFTPNPDPGTSDADIGAWRYEVQAASASEREYFFHVLSVGDNTPQQQAPAIQNLSSSTAAVSLLGGSQVIAFNKLDDMSSMTSWNMPVNTLDMLILGLSPDSGYSATAVNTGASYQITLCRDAAGLLQSSLQGTLEITSGLTASPDLDGDGIGDSCDLDIDGDGLLNTDEVIYGTDPLNPDTDNDLLVDGDEINLYSTDPLNPDTDNDGYRDGAEASEGSNPLDPQSIPVITADGDVSLDGNVNAADILLSQRHLLGLTSLNAEQLAHGDLYPVLGDSLLTLSDTLLIMKKALQAQLP
jgi:hypothetical protein